MLISRIVRTCPRSTGSEGPNSGGGVTHVFIIWMITDDQQRRSGIMNRQKLPGNNK